MARSRLRRPASRHDSTYLNRKLPGYLKTDVTERQVHQGRPVPLASAGSTDATGKMASLDLKDDPENAGPTGVTGKTAATGSTENREHQEPPGRKVRRAKKDSMGSTGKTGSTAGTGRSKT